MAEINELKVKCAERFTKLEEKIIVLEGRVICINDLSKQINGLVISIDRLSTRLETIEKTIVKMDNRIESLAKRIETMEHAPIKRSEKLRLGAIGSLIGAIIGAVVGYIINLL